MASVRIARNRVQRRAEIPNLHQIWSSRLKTSGSKPTESLRAVAHSMLLCRIHFADGLIPSRWKKDWVVPKAVRASGRPDQRAAYAPLEAFAMAIWPSERQHAHKLGTPV